MPECEHGAPGGEPATCALCRVQLAHEIELLERRDWWPDVRALAAADRD